MSNDFGSFIITTVCIRKIPNCVLCSRGACVYVTLRRSTRVTSLYKQMATDRLKVVKQNDYVTYCRATVFGVPIIFMACTRSSDSGLAAILSPSLSPSLQLRERVREKATYISYCGFCSHWQPIQRPFNTQQHPYSNFELTPSKFEQLPIIIQCTISKRYRKLSRNRRYINISSNADSLDSRKWRQVCVCVFESWPEKFRTEKRANRVNVRASGVWGKNFITSINSTQIDIILGKPKGVRTEFPAPHQNMHRCSNTVDIYVILKGYEPFHFPFWPEIGLDRNTRMIHSKAS